MHSWRKGQQLMLREVDFRNVFDASPNPYMVLDASLRFVTANHAYLAVTGSRLEELIGRDVFDAFPNDPEDPSNTSLRMLRSSLERVLATGKPDHLALIPYRVARAPGEPLEARWWSATHTPILDEDGRVAFVLQHTVDVTDTEELKALVSSVGVLDRARAVQAANASLDEELRGLRSLFEQAPGFVAVLRGPEHVYEIVNASYERLIGDRPLVGRRLRDALPEVVEQGVVDILDRVYRTGEAYVGRALKVALARHRDDPLEELYLDLVYQPFNDATGKVAGIFVQGADVTAAKRLHDEREAREVERSALLASEQESRAKAEEANRLKDEFLATVSHELRTPLTGVLGWVQVLRSSRYRLTPERQEGLLETIERNARMLAQLVDDLLDVSRIISGKMTLAVQSLAISDPIEAAIEAVRPAATAKAVRVATTVDPDVFVLGDPARLQQIVWNLLSNAVKFTPKGGRVHVMARRVGSSVEIAVFDTGAGIDPEFLPFVFDRFRQADGKPTRAHGGLGLGLAIVKHLVELHGGTISAESEGLGRGASFRVLLPMSAARAERTPALAGDLRVDTQPSELEGVRVLVVEDEPDTRELVRDILTSCGATVTLAGSAPEALDKLDVSVPDIVVSDINMPRQDGVDLIRSIRARPRARGGRVPAVALTAHARTEDRTRLLRAGYQAHVPKPVDVPELIAVLGALSPRDA